MKKTKAKSEEKGVDNNNEEGDKEL